MTKISKQEKQMFDYLNDLRNFGETNMLGSGPFLVEEFGISNAEARQVLMKWIENFNEDGYEHLLNENE